MRLVAVGIEIDLYADVELLRAKVMHARAAIPKLIAANRSRSGPRTPWPLPPGFTAIRTPCRMALSYRCGSGEENEHEAFSR